MVTVCHLPELITSMCIYADGNLNVSARRGYFQASVADPVPFLSNADLIPYRYSFSPGRTKDLTLHNGKCRVRCYHAKYNHDTRILRKR